MPQERITCRFWRNGTYGCDDTRCKYLHEDTDLISPPLPWTCYRWSERRCTRHANDCLYTHSWKADPPQIPKTFGPNQRALSGRNAAIAEAALKAGFNVANAESLTKLINAVKGAAYGKIVNIFPVSSVPPFREPRFSSSHWEPDLDYSCLPRFPSDSWRPEPGRYDVPDHLHVRLSHRLPQETKLEHNLRLASHDLQPGRLLVPERQTYYSAELDHFPTKVFPREEEPRLTSKVPNPHELIIRVPSQSDPNRESLGRPRAPKHGFEAYNDDNDQGRSFKVRKLVETCVVKAPTQHNRDHPTPAKEGFCPGSCDTYSHVDTNKKDYHRRSTSTAAAKVAPTIPTGPCTMSRTRASRGARRKAARARRVQGALARVGADYRAEVGFQAKSDCRKEADRRAETLRPIGTVRSVPVYNENATIDLFEKISRKLCQGKAAIQADRTSLSELWDLDERLRRPQAVIELNKLGQGLRDAEHGLTDGIQAVYRLIGEPV